MKPPVFIVGAARSGTGLLRNLLRSHPNLSFPPESHFLPHFYRAYGDPVSDEAACALARRILAFNRLRRWNLALRPEHFADCRSYAALIDRLYTAWAAREGKPRWGDKTPHYVSHVPTLAEIFPSLRVLHIIRDGRASACSWVSHPKGPANHWVAARTWRERVSAGRRGGAQLPPGAYLEVRYERLLAEPDACLAEIYAFLDEPVPEKPVELSPLPVDRHHRGVSLTEIVSDNADAWRGRMTPRQQRLVEAEAGGLLAELGYDVEAPGQGVAPWRGWLWRAHSRVHHYLRLLRSPRRLQDDLTLFVAGLRARH